MTSIGDGASDVTGVSGVNSIGEDKSVMFKAYLVPLYIHPCWHEFPLGTFRSGDLRVAPSLSEEHDARDTNHSYKDMMREDAVQFSDSLVRAPTQQELKISESVTAYNADDMDEVAGIDEHEEKRRKWKAYHSGVRKHHPGISKASSSKDNSSY